MIFVDDFRGVMRMLSRVRNRRSSSADRLEESADPKDESLTRTGHQGVEPIAGTRLDGTRKGIAVCIVSPLPATREEMRIGERSPRLLSYQRNDASQFACKAWFVFLRSYPAFLVFFASPPGWWRWYRRNGRQGRPSMSLSRRSSSESNAARTRRIDSAPPASQNFSVPLTR